MLSILPPLSVMWSSIFVMQDAIACYWRPQSMKLRLRILHPQNITPQRLSYRIDHWQTSG